MFAYRLTFNPRSKATNMVIISFGELSLAVTAETKSELMLEDLRIRQQVVAFQKTKVLKLAA